jgi:hypothetical protein
MRSRGKFETCWTVSPKSYRPAAGRQNSLKFQGIVRRSRHAQESKGSAGVLRVRPPAPRRQGSPIRAPVTTKSLLQKLLRKNDTLHYVDQITTEGLARHVRRFNLPRHRGHRRQRPDKPLRGRTDSNLAQKSRAKTTRGKEKIEFTRDIRLVAGLPYANLKRIAAICHNGQRCQNQPLLPRPHDPHGESCSNQISADHFSIWRTHPIHNLRTTLFGEERSIHT